MPSEHTGVTEGASVQVTPAQPANPTADPESNPAQPAASYTHVSPAIERASQSVANGISRRRASRATSAASASIRTLATT